MPNWRQKAESLQTEANSQGIQKFVAGAVVIRDGRVLLLRRQRGDFLEELYELPSGGRQTHENIVDTLIRETNEETGLNIHRIKRFIDFFDYLSSTGRRTRQFNFHVEASGVVVIDPAEHSEAVWLRPTEVLALKGKVSSETLNVITIAFGSDQLLSKKLKA
jgi:8-oxo-dGTP diphosphatase